MGLTAFNYGANIVAFIKNNKKYGMCCSWAMQVDYDKVCLLIGAQSVTGDMIKEEDLIGVSSLNENQTTITEIFGDGHSDKKDKFENVKYSVKNDAITIDEAKVEMVVKVIEVIRLQGIESDRLVYGKIIDVKENPEVKFLNMNDLK